MAQHDHRVAVVPGPQAEEERHGGLRPFLGAGILRRRPAEDASEHVGVNNQPTCPLPSGRGIEGGRLPGRLPADANGQPFHHVDEPGRLLSLPELVDVLVA